MTRDGWKRLSRPDGYTCFGHWLHEPTGHQVAHCGHPTANWPYYITTNDGQKIIAPNGHGFRTLKLAMEAAEQIN